MTKSSEAVSGVPRHLRSAQEKASRQKRERIAAALAGMIEEGSAITFAGLARRARVSRSLLYIDGVREEVEAARLSTSGSLCASSLASRPANTELALLVRRNAKLRREIADLRNALRRKLGEEVIFGDLAALRAEVEDLSQANAELTSELAKVEDELDQRREQCQELEDTLSSSRELIRKMIREGNET